MPYVSPTIPNGDGLRIRAPTGIGPCTCKVVINAGSAGGSPDRQRQTPAVTPSKAASTNNAAIRYLAMYGHAMDDVIECCAIGPAEWPGMAPRWRHSGFPPDQRWIS